MGTEKAFCQALFTCQASQKVCPVTVVTVYLYFKQVPIIGMENVV